MSMWTARQESQVRTVTNQTAEQQKFENSLGSSGVQTAGCGAAEVYSSVIFF